MTGMAIDFGRHLLQCFRHIYFRWWFSLGDVRFRFRISPPGTHGAMYCMYVSFRGQVPCDIGSLAASGFR